MEVASMAHECKNCKGLGRTLCFRCGGTGELSGCECNYCGGSGVITCGACDGTGKIDD